MKQIQIQCVDNGWVVVFTDGNSPKPTVAVFTNRFEMQQHITELLDSTGTDD